ncbi:hypothetical protein SUBVAR_05496 [Subdoligranulum variabile DSM 15176]|uniref:Uncharacterized protein n=1 Tax=Subdoligranulum variabile DSM 15176 TaxID=411471 RepID=D1PMD6_9FIRM|nr:hypothetical protein SUBVAR_05496 [Subdoligranulum variabile DSM 15176]
MYDTNQTFAPQKQRVCSAMAAEQTHTQTKRPSKHDALLFSASTFGPSATRVLFPTKQRFVSVLPRSMNSKAGLPALASRPGPASSRTIVQ